MLGTQKETILKPSTIPNPITRYLQTLSRGLTKDRVKRGNVGELILTSTGRQGH